MVGDGRPLSPHLQIYRWQLTSVLSILHRGTGLALAVGLVALVWWLVTIGAGAGYYAWSQWFFASLIGRAMLFGWSFALFYHLCNGIRHLVWDSGRGFNLATTYRSGWLVVASAGTLTVAAWIAGYVSRAS